MLVSMSGRAEGLQTLLGVLPLSTQNDVTAHSWGGIGLSDLHLDIVYFFLSKILDTVYFFFSEQNSWIQFTSSHGITLQGKEERKL